jgi:hypothetical protein
MNSDFIFIQGVMLDLNSFGSIQSGAYIGNDKWFIRFKNKEHTTTVYQFDFDTIEGVVSVMESLAKYKGVYNESEFKNLTEYFEEKATKTNGG